MRRTYYYISIIIIIIIIMTYNLLKTKHNMHINAVGFFLT